MSNFTPPSLSLKVKDYSLHVRTGRQEEQAPPPKSRIDSKMWNEMEEGRLKSQRVVWSGCSDLHYHWKRCSYGCSSKLDSALSCFCISNTIICMLPCTIYIKQFKICPVVHAQTVQVILRCWGTSTWNHTSMVCWLKHLVYCLALQGICRRLL